LLVSLQRTKSSKPLFLSETQEKRDSSIFFKPLDLKKTIEMTVYGWVYFR